MKPCRSTRNAAELHQRPRRHGRIVDRPVMPTQIGHVWGAGGRLEFCDMGIIAPEVRMGLVAPDGASGDTDFTVASAVSPPASAMPAPGIPGRSPSTCRRRSGRSITALPVPGTRFADEFMTEHRYRRDADPSD